MHKYDIGMYICAAIFVILLVNIAFINPPRLTIGQTQNETSVTFTSTAESTHDALPGHFMHQAVIVLPARHDGDLWVGTISWVSSKPVELRLLYDYNFNLHPDAAHGTPPNTQFQFGQTGNVAISLIKPPNIITTGGQYFAGTLPFVAKAVALHNIEGIPFTATYSVDAVAKPVTK